MRKDVLKVVFTICIALTVLFACGRGAMGTPITIGDVIGAPGGTVVVPVTAGVGGFTGIGSSYFEIQYPTLYLDATTVTNGGFLGSFTSNIADSPDPGTVTAGSINLSGDTVAGGADFFSISFDIAGGAPDGVYTLSFISADLTDTSLPLPGTIDTSMVDGSITVAAVITEPAVVPEPATIALLGMGFLGIAGYVRKRRLK